MAKKIIRTICLFTDDLGYQDEQRLFNLAAMFNDAAYQVQTLRLVTRGMSIAELRHRWTEPELFIGAGTLTREQAHSQLGDFMEAANLSFNLEINDHVTTDDVNLLFEIIKTRPEKTFNFSYTFNNAPSTPFFPAAHYTRKGFAVGLQSTNLADGCKSLHTWLFRMKEAWEEIMQLMKHEKGFLGIDSSVAPMYYGNGSLINMMKRIYGSFRNSVTTEAYVNITQFIKSENPLPVGLNGLMFPCLEDFELAEEYENGEFNIERNIYLSLHSGVGIDTYPLGIDENPERVRQILNLLLALSTKYGKPLSARFVSDGKAKTGERTDFQNHYLKDVMIKAL